MIGLVKLIARHSAMKLARTWHLPGSPCYKDASRGKTVQNSLCADRASVRPSYIFLDISLWNERQLAYNNDCNLCPWACGKTSPVQCNGLGFESPYRQS
jgi:hypothetical protein